jgi:hypothetical protein
MQSGVQAFSRLPPLQPGQQMILGFDNGKTNDWMMQVISAQGVSATVASLR